MLIDYDPTVFANDAATVRFTLRRMRYRGHFACRVVGCSLKGWQILETAADTDALAEACIGEMLEENDCGLEFDDDTGFFTAVLTDKDGGKLKVNMRPDELERYMVAAEIIKVERI